MTTLAIVGAGIAGRSLVYTLANEQIRFDKIFLFYSDSFAPSCSLNSTAIVAARGVSSGMSPLGDMLQESFLDFKAHVLSHHPAGVCQVQQYTGSHTKLEQFKKRYPDGKECLSAGGIKFKKSIYLATEDAFMLDPATYLAWLLSQAEQKLSIEVIDDFVVEFDTTDKIQIKTQSGQIYSADELSLTAGAAGRFWKNLLPGKLESSKPVQGSYLEFSVDLGIESLSLTLDGDNFIYDQSKCRLLIGSTTHDHIHQLAPVNELKAIYGRLQEYLELKLPEFKTATIKVGMREKASKREPYLIEENKISVIGGLYKNGYSLGMLMAKKLARKYSSSSSHLHP